MIVNEIQILSESLWEAVKSDLKFFSSIQTFAKRLAEVDYSELDRNELNNIKLYIGSIESFFEKWRSTGTALYIPPHQTDNNDATVKRLHQLVMQLDSMSEGELSKVAQEVKPTPKNTSKGSGAVFIGHGRSKLWAMLQLHLQEEYKLKTLVFESESRASETIVNILEGFLEQASFAILIMTAEDETGDGKMRARQNVIHEAGLFQGRLGFRKVIILKQAEMEDFSNIAGLQYISFSGENLEQTFYQLGKALKKNGLII